MMHQSKHLAVNAMSKLTKKQSMYFDQISLYQYLQINTCIYQLTPDSTF